MSDDHYLYPGTQTLKNKLDIRDPSQLGKIERQLVTQRIRQGVPEGQFDLAHLQGIHRHLFQDVYSWAGELRQVEIAKGGHQFQFRQYIATGMADVHGRLVKQNYLRGLNKAEFAREAGAIMGDVNYVHPFREGNGRTQLQYLKQLGQQAGHNVDLGRLDPKGWIEASKRAHAADYAPMSRAIEEAITERGQERQGERQSSLDRARERAAACKEQSRHQGRSKSRGGERER